MLLVSKSQYSENDYITQSNLQIQCNSYQIINGIFHRANHYTICIQIIIQFENTQDYK